MMDTSGPLAVGGVSLRLYPHDLSAQGRIDELRLQARLAVEAGFDGVMVSEHHADFFGYLPNPWQMCNFLLPAMPRGWVAPAPILLPMMPYAILAEYVAWLQAAYPGRVGAGFGMGAFKSDFDLVGVPIDEIRDRFVEALPKIVAALRGQDPTPLGQDRALAACKDAPIPMAVAAQSTGAVKRAAGLNTGIMYDSIQPNEHSRKLSDLYTATGGSAAKILIRRVWIGDMPEENVKAQMAAFMAVAPDRAKKNWTGESQTCVAPTGEEAAELLAQTMIESGTNTANVRIYVKGLEPAQVRAQLERHGSEFIPRFRKLMAERVLPAVRA